MAKPCLTAAVMAMMTVMMVMVTKKESNGT